MFAGRWLGDRQQFSLSFPVKELSDLLEQYDQHSDVTGNVYSKPVRWNTPIDLNDQQNNTTPDNHRWIKFAPSHPYAKR